MHHVIDEQAVDNIFGSAVLNENRLFTVYCSESISFILSRYLPCSIDALEEGQDISFCYRLWPPVGRSNLDHVISHITVQVCLLRIRLEDLISMWHCYCH